MISKIGANLFPSVFAPPFLNGLSPSWTGIIARIWSPARIVNHPVYGSYQTTLISRDEERRLRALTFEKLISQYPGKYHECVIRDYDGTSKNEK